LLVCLIHAALLTIFCAGFAAAQTAESLAARIDRVMSRPEFRHANFGIEFYSLDSGKVVYALNADKMFVPASTTKLLTEGTVLAKLGADYRFHTRIYRTGPLDSKGRLKGDVVLVASGDPNLSNRIQPDGTLAFVDEDHSYNGPALPGDPLTVIKQLAKDVAAKGLRRIEGRVLVDASLVRAYPLGSQAPIWNLPTTLFLNPGNYTVSGSGGKDVGAIKVPLTVSSPVTWSNRDQITAVDRSMPLTLNWSGGPKGQTIEIFGENSDLRTNSSAVFYCVAPSGSTSFTVPPQVLGFIPPTRPNPLDSTGIIFLISSSSSPFSAQGLNVGLASATYKSGKTVVFQ